MIYTNLIVPNKNRLPINAFDSSLLRERRMCELLKCDEKEDTIEWYLGASSKYAIDVCKFQRLLSVIQSLEIHCAGGNSFPKSVNDMLQALNVSPHVRHSMYIFIMNEIPRVVVINDSGVSKEDGIFFSSNGIFTRHVVKAADHDQHRGNRTPGWLN